MSEMRDNDFRPAAGEATGRLREWMNLHITVECMEGRNLSLFAGGNLL